MAGSGILLRGATAGAGVHLRVTYQLTRVTDTVEVSTTRPYMSLSSNLAVAPPGTSVPLPAVVFDAPRVKMNEHVPGGSSPVTALHLTPWMKERKRIALLSGSAVSSSGGRPTRGICPTVGHEDHRLGHDYDPGYTGPQELQPVARATRDALVREEVDQPKTLAV